MGEDTTRDGIQILGGWGYMREYDVERLYRDARLASIGAGSSEVMRMIVGSGLAPFSKVEEALSVLQESKHDATIKQTYGSSVGNEVELLEALQGFLKSVASKIQESKEQSVTFAYASLASVYFVLKQAYWDCAYASRDYNIQDKKRDLLLLSYFLLGKYFSAIQVLHSFDPDKAQRLADAFIKLENIQESITDSVEYMQKILGMSLVAS